MGTIKATIKHIYINGQSVHSGYFSPKSKPIFRSESARYTLFIQMSKEMWDFDTEGAGEIMFNKVVSGFLPDLFKRWLRINARHLVTIILFTRMQYDGEPLADRPEGTTSNNHSEPQSGSFRDYYRVVVSDMASGDWINILYQLKKEFRMFLKEVSLVRKPVRHVNNSEELGSEGGATYTVVAGRPSSASQGNILEAINLAAVQFAKDYIDRDLVRTGISVIVVSPGTGVFEVDYNMLKLTTDTLIGSGIGIDLVCLSPMPLHSVPLFKYRTPRSVSELEAQEEKDQYPSAGPLRAEEDKTPRQSQPNFGSLSRTSVLRHVPKDDSIDTSDGWRFAMPYWVDISFWSGTSEEILELTKPRKADKIVRKSRKKGRIFSLRCRLYELQMMGVMENELGDIAIPYLEEDPMYPHHLRELFDPNEEGLQRAPVVKPSAPGAGSYSSRGDREYTDDQLDETRAAHKAWMEAYDGAVFSTLMERRSANQLQLHQRMPSDQLSRGSPEQSKSSHLSTSFRSIIEGSRESVSAREDSPAPSRRSSPPKRAGLPIVSGKAAAPVNPELKSRPSNWFLRQISFGGKATPAQPTLGDATIDISQGKVKPAMLTVEKNQKGAIAESGGAREAPRTLSPTSAIAPWAVLVNPCNPKKNAITSKNQYRRWHHVFPRTLRTGTVKWRSLCSPAAVPLTHEWFPSVDQIATEYNESPYKITQNDDDEILEAPKSRESLIRELIAFRLSHGFQVIVGSSVAEFSGRQEKALASILAPDYMSNDGDTVFMSVGNNIHQLTAIFSDAEKYHKSNIDIKKLAEDLQGDKGIQMLDRRWHLKLHYNCFLGFDLINWLLSNFKDIETRDEAVDFGNELMSKGLFQHVQRRHQFRDGNFFFQIAAEYRAPRNESRTGWFGMRKSDKKRSYRPEIISLHYDRLHNPDNCYHIRIDWMNVTAKLIEDAIVTWATSVEKYGLKLVEVPIAEVSDIVDTHPFRSPYVIKLALQPPQAQPETMWDSTSFSPQYMKTDKFAYHKALLRRLNFVLDMEAASAFPPDIDVTYSWGSPDYKYTQFIHRSGGVLAQITDEGDFLLLANRLAHNRGKDNSRIRHVDPYEHKKATTDGSQSSRLPSTPAVERGNPHRSPFASPLARPVQDASLLHTALSFHDVKSSTATTPPLVPAATVTPEQVKEEVEAFCSSASLLATFYADAFRHAPSPSPRITPVSEEKIPSLGLPPAIWIRDASPATGGWTLSSTFGGTSGIAGRRQGSEGSMSNMSKRGSIVEGMDFAPRRDGSLGSAGGRNMARDSDDRA
ncbi:vacuolar membrane-associated protein iml1 [Pyrenophora tritici-repentis Pt-1C-BFP]|uniref:Vacuolar membrane-associated protein IML1 n=1 Tax=Pyrenophora tritici-repentis (strain Pt-1C-BFP) TaxID=426418 RepID=B2WGJ4_PYRTR|nr:vacuolar membrane-associated protein iml1 [Pyrenophora tritici-repentis Pt-1C-BFP]EDU42101.1 vacuolar membrane-associated protein iml1 [Pyrenophora tritici-repentis Pt-1C-BFP]